MQGNQTAVQFINQIIGPHVCENTFIFLLHDSVSVSIQKVRYMYIYTTSMTIIHIHYCGNQNPDLNPTKQIWDALDILWN